MINTYKYKGETWIDIDNGTPDEIHLIMTRHNIHPYVAKEIESTTPKPRLEFHDHYIYCIMHFPAWKHTHSLDKNQEIDFIVSKDVLITARYDTIDALHKLSKDLEVDEILEKKGDAHPKHSHVIFMQMLRQLYRNLYDELFAIEDNIEKITSQIFESKERKMVVSISEITRTLLDFRRTVDQHGGILESIQRRGEKMFGERFGHEMESVILDYLKINTAIKLNMDSLKELRETDDSLLAAKQTETIKRLTLIGAILFVISILVAMFR